ncbi:hypothetical protein HQ590_09785 [bacterium]|nr:hypothetical protein [bacterium]
MKLGRKPVRPVDRALADLEHQIAATEREIRRVEYQRPATPPPPAATAPAPRPTADRTGASLALESSAEFIRRMLVPGSAPGAPVARTRRDLFDIPTDPLKDLDDGREPAPHRVNALAGRRPARDGAAAAVVATPSRAADADARLVEYLSVGSLRAARPLKHVQRRERNRFLMWLGLALAVLWVLYVVVR